MTNFCIKRPITAAMFFLALMVLGVMSYFRMPIDLFPQITYPAINISTNYTGAGPEEIEELITIPVEQAVSGVNMVKSITSSSREGNSRVTVNFNWGLNLEEATNDIRSALDRVRSRLPDEAETPVIFKYDPSQSPVMSIGLSGQMNEAALRELADEELSYQLQKVEGVARVEVRGGRNEEIQIRLRQDRLYALGITADQVATALKNENSMQAAGHIDVGVGDFLLRTQGQFKALDEMRNLVIATRNGIPIYLKDIAAVEPGYSTTTAYVRIDGEPGIVISVQKRSGFNTVAVADGLYRAIDDLQRTHPGITMRVLNDDSIYIRRAVDSVSHEAVMGALLAGLILLFFFHNFRVTVITGLVIPVSILITIMLAYFFKMSLNTFSLGGLALGVGMLVDCAVVVLDNIFRHYHENRTDLATAALTGTREMGPAISASTLTQICVFFPLIYVSGRSGIIFKELAYMVIFSNICALLVAITLLPTLCAKFLKIGDLDESAAVGIKGYLTRMQRGWEISYRGALEWCLDHKRLVLLGCGGVFLLSLALYPFIGTELVQTTDEGVISINMQFPTGTRLEDTDFETQRLEHKIRELVPEIEHMETSVGGRAGGGSTPNRSFLTLRLKPRAERNRSTQEIVDQIQPQLQVPGARIRAHAPSSMRMFYGGSQFPVEVDVRSKDPELSLQTAEAVMDIMEEIPGISNANISLEEARPELVLLIDRKRAADLGITAATIATAIQTNVDGRVATIYRVGGEETDVRVQLQEGDRQNWQDLRRVMVSGSGGRSVPVANLVQIVQSNGPVAIERKDRERNLEVQASLAEGRDLASAMRDVQAAVGTLSLPPGVNIYYSGDYLEQEESAREMLITFILALMLVYMVMAAQFESFFDPFVIMIAIPFALSGVLITLLLTSTNINTQVYLGIIMLGGIVVNNTIVMISFIRILIVEGLPLREAVLVGASSRLRPILITTVTTALGLIPMAFGLGEGSETQTPLARTVIGGLISSTVLTLILIPVIFISLESWLQRLNVRRPKAPAVAGIVLALLIFAGVAAPVRAAEARKLTLSDAVKLALSDGEDGKIIKHSREAAESALRENNGKKGINLYSEVTGEASDSGELKVTAAKSVPLADLLGVQSLTDQIAVSNRNTAFFSADQQEQQLIYQVVGAYQKELSAASDLRLAEENYRRSKEFLDEVQARSGLGLTSISDETGAEAQAAGALTNLNRARQVYQLARLKLRQLLALPADAELELSAAPAQPGAVSFEALKDGFDASRPDLRMARESVARAEANLKLARIADKLGIAFNWNLRRDAFETNLTLTNFPSGRAGDSNTSRPGEWTVGADASLIPARWPDHRDNDGPEYGELAVTLRWTFLDGNVRKERIKQAESLLAQTREQMARTVKNADYELEEAYYNYLNLVDRLKSGEIQLRYNRTYYESVQAKLRVGMATVKDVLDAQLVFSQSEIDYERTRSDLYLARVNLLRVTGELSAAQF